MSVKKLSIASKSLINLSQALVQSGSHVEDYFWEAELNKAVVKSLGSKRSNKDIENALDALLDQRSPAYEILVEFAEASSESVKIEHKGIVWQALLVCSPILVRTRYKLPNGALKTKQINQLNDLFQDLIITENSKINIYPELVRFDKLPQTFREVRQLSIAMAENVLAIKNNKLNLSGTEAPSDLLADAFFILGVIVTPEKQAIFQWQNTLDNCHAIHKKINDDWATNCNLIFKNTFAGCLNEYLSPGAFYTNTRKADQYIRPITLKAAINWLDSVVHIPLADLRAAIVACGDNKVEEYRIGFTTTDSKDVIYGCIWPSLNREEASPDQIEEGQISPWDVIAAVLKESGINHIRRIPGIQAMDFCDECGAPYFPNMSGEMLHPELPEEADLDPIQFH